MAKTHSSLTTSDLHHPKGFSVESTASMFVMSQSISTATASFHFIPDDTDTYTLGNTARAWKELYVSTGSIHFVEKDGTVARTLDVDSTGFGFGGGDVSGSTISGSKLHIVGSTFIGGDLTLGDADSDSISIGADLTSNLIPNQDNNYDLGSSGKQWKDIYINGIGYIDQLGTDADPVAAYISSGELDGVVIGGESAAAATVTTFNLTSIGGNWTNASNTVADLGTVTTIDINGGSIDGAAIGAASHTTIKGTTIDATSDFTIDGLVISADDITNDAALEIQTAAGDITLDPGGNNVLPGSDDADDLGSSTQQWKDLYIDGVAYIDTLNADALGANLDHGNYNSTNVDIDSGAIDGTTIGANSAAAGTFTNLQVTTDVNIDDSGGDGAMDGVIIGAAAAAAGTFTTLNTTGLTALAGNVDLGDATSDTITATARFDSDIVPSSDSARDLGTSALQFAEAHIDTGHIDDITATGTSTLSTVDIGAGAIDGTTIGAASHTTIKGTTIDATTDFTIDGLVLTADTITNDSNLTMDLAGDLAIDVDGGDVTITDNGADILTINATTISGSATSSGSFAHIAVNSVSASRMEIDSIQGNWTNAGNTIADLGSVTTCDINGGTINGIEDLAIVDGGTGASTLNNLITLSTHTTGNYVATITGGTGITSTAATSGEGTTHSLSIDAAQTQITSVGTIGTGTWEATDVAVAHGGTGASSLTDGGILLGSGTSAITATAVLGDGEILIGDGTTDPVPLDVGGSGAITILGTIATGVWEGTTVAVDQGGTGVTTKTGTGNVVLSSSPTIVTPTIASFTNSTHDHADSAGGGVIALGTATSGNYVGTITGGTGITSTAATSGEGTTHSLSVDAAQTQITSVGTIGTGVWQGTAINDTYIDTINNANKVALTALDIDGGTDVGEAIVDGDLIILDNGADGTNRKATMSRLKTYMSGVSGGSTLGNVQVGVTAATEIDTTSGNLVIDSAGGTTTLDDHVIISGNLTVSGTETIIDSTRLDIGDKIIELNAAGSDGGIYVKETSGGNATGSMLWDVSANRWFAGLAGSEANVVLVDTSDTLTNKTLTTPVIGSFTNATHTHANSAGGGVIALGTATSGNYVGTITGGTGITSTAATSGEGTTHSLSVDASQTQITAVGTIATGVWQGTDVGVAYGGTGASTLNNLITMGTHTTGNYVATVADSGGGGITVANSGAESAAVTLELDIHGLTTDAIASGDFIAFSDEGESGDPANKETIDDVATLFAGTGLTAASAVLGVDASQTQITSVGTIGTGVWQGTDVGVAYGGTGASTLNDLITLGTHTTGNYVATITGGTSITSTAATSGEGTTHSLSVDDVFVRNDGNDTTSGNLTVGGLTLGGHGVDDLDITSEASNADDHLMTALAIQNRIQDYGYSTTTGTVTNVATSGTVNGITLTGGAITSTGTVTLGGTLAINNGDWSGTDLSVANGGTGASSLSNLIALTTHTTGNYVKKVTVGTGLGGAVDSEGGTAAMTLDAAQTAITSVLNTGLKVGYDNNDCFNFATGSDGQISVYQNMIEEFRFTAGGTFHADADVVAYSSTVASDMSLKENITDTKYGLSDIMKLRGVDFDWKRKDMGHSVGVLAQEVEAVIPEIVKEHEGLHGREKFKAVDYNKLVPVLIESIKELKKEIDDLKSN